MKKSVEITTTNATELTYLQITELKSVNEFVEQANIVNNNQRLLCKYAYDMYTDLQKASNKDALEMACDFIQMSKSSVVQMAHTGEILNYFEVLIPDDWGTAKIVELWKIKGENKLESIKDFLIAKGKDIDYLTVKELREEIKFYNGELIENEKDYEKVTNENNATDTTTEDGADNNNNGQDNDNHNYAIGVINRLIERGTGTELDDSDIKDLKFILKFVL